MYPHLCMDRITNLSHMARLTTCSSGHCLMPSRDSTYDRAGLGEALNIPWQPELWLILATNEPVVKSTSLIATNRAFFFPFLFHVWLNSCQVELIILASTSSHRDKTFNSQFIEILCPISGDCPCEKTCPNVTQCNHTSIWSTPTHTPTPTNVNNA